MSTGPVLRGRLDETCKRLDKLGEDLKVVSQEAERTKVRMVAKANGSFIRVKEIIDGTRDKS